MKNASGIYLLHRRRLAVARYCFILVAIVLMGIAMVIPSLQYATSATGTVDRISATELIKNAWRSVREVLFGGGEQLSATIRFSRAVLITTILSVVLFLIGVAASVLGTVGACRSILGVEQSQNERALWRTLFPNRAVLWLWHISLLPLLAFGRVLVFFYAFFLSNESVTLRAGLLDPLLVGLLLLALYAVVLSVGAPKERALGIDPFPAKQSEEDDDREEVRHDSILGDEDAALRAQREQQILALRRMLNREKESEDHDE